MRRRKGNKLFWFIIILIMFPSLARVLGSVIAGLATGFLGLALVIVAIYFVIKLLKKDGYVEVEKDADERENKQNANPYSRTSMETDRAHSVTQTVEVPKPAPKPEPKPAPKPVRPSTGDPELDKMIEDKDKAIAEMHRLNNNIEDPTLSDQIDHLESVTNKIVNYVVAHPNKKKEVTKFMNYYLPTTLKILNAYDRMDDTGISGANIDGTKGKVEETMGMALSAFDKQLDALFAEEALDVTTDISVMENMLKAEGLMDDSLMMEAKEIAKLSQ